MHSPSPGRRQAIRSLIERFIAERLTTKLEGLADDDPKRATLLAQYAPDVWLEDAARRAGQIQAVTHTLKAIHPDAKGTNLYCLPSALPKHQLVGSHCLDDDFAGDVVGNAAALDDYKRLKLEYDGQTLLDLLLAADAYAIAALRSAAPVNPAHCDTSHNNPPTHAGRGGRPWAGCRRWRNRASAITPRPLCWWPPRC